MGLFWVLLGVSWDPFGASRSTPKGCATPASANLVQLQLFIILKNHPPEGCSVPLLSPRRLLGSAAAPPGDSWGLLGVSWAALGDSWPHNKFASVPFPRAPSWKICGRSVPLTVPVLSHRRPLGSGIVPPKAARFRYCPPARPSVSLFPRF